MHRNRRPVAILTILVLICGFTVPAPAADEKTYLETIAGFGGIYIYMTYAYIGVAADAYSKDIYEAEHIKNMMEETVNMLNNLTQLLAKVQATDLSAEDKEFVQDLVHVMGLLKIESESLAAFAVSNDPADVARYEEARKKAWPEISKLLGMQ
jgi:hypothetical protein